MQIEKVDERKLVELGRIINELNPPKSFNLDGLRVTVMGFQGDNTQNSHFKVLIGPDEEPADLFLGEFLEDMDKEGSGSVLKARLLNQTNNDVLEIKYMGINDKNTDEGEIEFIRGSNLPVNALVMVRDKKIIEIEYQFMFTQEKEATPKDNRWEIEESSNKQFFINKTYITRGLPIGKRNVFLFVRMVGANEYVERKGRIELIDGEKVEPPEKRPNKLKLKLEKPDLSEPVVEEPSRKKRPPSNYLTADQIIHLNPPVKKPKPDDDGAITNIVGGTGSKGDVANVGDRLNGVLEKARATAESDHPHLSKRDQEELNVELIETAREGTADDIRALVLSGADVNATIHNGVKTAMNQAVAMGNIKTMRALHELGADVNGINSYGQTPMHWAANGNDTNLIRVLHGLGADVNFKDKRRKTPLDTAMLLSGDEIQSTLKELGAKLGRDLN
jgi:hypothetical protein